MNVFETEVDRYEQWFEKHTGVYQSEVTAVRTALDVVSPTGRGLEIGTGTGHFSTPFGITEGVEPAAAMRRMAERRGLHVLDAKAESLPYDDGTFDFALMVTTICFVDDARQACREAGRILKPEGKLIVGLVDRESALGRHYEAHREESPFYRSARFFSVPELTEIMAVTGFSNFTYRQTLFQTLKQTDTPEPVISGHGQGGFVVVSGSRRRQRKPRIRPRE